MAFEARQRIAPEVPVLLEPLVNSHQRPRIEVIDALSALSALGYQLSISQYAQMSRDRGPADTKGGRDLSRRGFTIGKKPQNLAASRIRGSTENPLQCRATRNHIVTQY